jgi:hypothetical protein
MRSNAYAEPTRERACHPARGGMMIGLSPPPIPTHALHAL